MIALCYLKHCPSQLASTGEARAKRPTWVAPGNKERDRGERLAGRPPRPEPGADDPREGAEPEEPALLAVGASVAEGAQHLDRAAGSFAEEREEAGKGDRDV